MSNLVKRGRFWHYDITVSGVRHRGSTKQSDKALARAIVAKVEERASRAAVFGEKEELTFREAAKFYLAKNANDVKLVDRLVARIGSRRLADIIPGEIKALAMEFYPQGKPSTRNRNVIAPVSAVINHAASLGKAHLIRIPLFKITRPIKQAGSQEWLAAFRAACHAHARPDVAPRLAALARFMFETAARVSQATELEFDKLNLQEATAELKTRKTGADGPEFLWRIADITPGMVAEIANMPKPHPRKVFGFNDRHQVNKLWDRVVKAGKLPPLSRHEAGRHGFFTEMVVRHGVDPTSAAKSGGASPAVIHSNYTHAEKRREKILKVFGGKG